jgi:predicted RNase H-like HicB family nuclease
MQLLSIVEDYVMAAMRRAELEPMENGVVGATVPDCFGVVAVGADIHECSANLYARLEDWVRVSLERGYQLPVIDGIDLNTDAARVLATYHGGRQRPSAGEFLCDESELQAAFEQWDEEAAR